MAERPEDLNLPMSVVTRITKEALPDGCMISKEARLALSKAARFVVLSIFHEICYFPYANNTYSSNGNSQILVFYVSHLQQNKFITHSQPYQ